mgnify:CR=1 FL=1
MGYLVRRFDKKEYWSQFAGRFIHPYLKYPMTVYETFEDEDTMDEPHFDFMDRFKRK